MNKPRPIRKLAELTSEFLADAFKKQGFAATELVTRWKDIVGADIAAHAEPIKLQWPRETDGEPAEPATLVLRVEGPVAIEIQHQSAVILERINRFFGWQAVGRIALRQAPLSRPKVRAAPPKIDAAEAARVEATLTGVADDGLARGARAARRRRQRALTAPSGVYCHQTNVTAGHCRPWRTGPPMPHCGPRSVPDLNPYGVFR